MSAIIGILAAGASSRMRGTDKLLEPVEGEPLLARQIRVARGTGQPVLVALPRDAVERHHLVEVGAATPVAVANAMDGMGASIAALGTEASRTGAAALLILLADMPEITTEDLSVLLRESSRHPSSVIRAGTATGEAGHPVVFPRMLFGELARLSGDRGARLIVADAQDVRIVRLPGNRAMVDLDTPEEWDAWRSSRHGRPG